MRRTRCLVWIGCLLITSCARPQSDLPVPQPLSDGGSGSRGLPSAVGADPVPSLEPSLSSPTPGTESTPRPGPAGRLMGIGLPGFSGDGGPAWLAALSHPAGVTTRRGEVLVSDTGNGRIRRIDADGLASTWLGPDPAIDPPLTGPTRIVADDLSGLVFFTEPTLGLVRCVDIEGRVITVLGGGSLSAIQAGSGVSGRDAHLSAPVGLALDPAGRLLVADAGAHVVWQVDLDTGWRARGLAGSGAAGGTGDGGPAIAAGLDGPVDVQVTPGGEVLVVEESGHRVRRIRTDGVIERVAGTGLPGHDGDGLPALRSRLRGPTSVLALQDGTLYLTDRGNHRLVRVAPDGVMTAVAIEVEDPALLVPVSDQQGLLLDPGRHDLHAIHLAPTEGPATDVTGLP